jgi:uncharacterized membrane protein
MRSLVILGILFTVSMNSAYAIETLACHGAEPFWNATLSTDKVTFRVLSSPKTYLAPMYSSAAGVPLDYVMSVRAKRKKSNLIAFVVNQTRMLVADKHGAAAADLYLAYCTDAMSSLAFHFSIHLIVDGRPYTGCCSSASAPPVGQD